MAATAHKYEVIDRETLKAKMDKKEPFQLWNVLPKESFKHEMNIPGSHWVPVNALNEKTAEHRAGKDETIVTYCAGKSCPASKDAAEKLCAMGYKHVFAYEGGLEDWTQAGMPLAKI